MARKRTDSAAKAFVARVCRELAISFTYGLRLGRGALATHNDTVFPSKDGKFIETSDQIPTGSNVASDEDAERQNRKGVHRSAIPRGSTCRPLVKA